MKTFTQRSTVLLLAAGMGLAAATAWSAETLQDVMKRAESESAGLAGGGEDLCTDGQAR